MKSHSPHAVVVGAGMGGLACAARLVAAGVPTTVLEAGARVGGRCGGYRADGFTVDFATHVFSMGSGGEVGHAARLVGQPVEFTVRDPVATVWLGERRFPFPARFRSPGAFLGLAWRAGALGEDPLGTARHFVQLCLGARGRSAPPADLSLRQWALRSTRNPRYHELLNLLSFLAFVLPYDRASALEMAHCFTRIVRGPGIGYPRGGCLGLVEAIARGIEQRGGRLSLGQPVEGIEVERGRVTAVRTAGERIPASHVFCNAGVKGTLALVGAEAMGARYVARAEGLTDSLAGVMVRYRLARPVFRDPVMFVMPPTAPATVCERIRDGRMQDAGPGFYVTVPSNFDPALAPPGRQIAIAGTLSYPELERSETEGPMLARMEARLAELVPGLSEAIEHREVVGVTQVALASGRRTTGEAVGVAQTPGQTGAHRPSWETPVRGLYVVGADTGSGAIGTELAAGSGLTAAQHVIASGCA